MNEILKKDIETEIEIIKKYDMAEQNKDEASMQDAIEAHDAHEAEIKARGINYYRVYEMAMDAKERGNEYIDINDCISEKDIKEMMDSFHLAGVEKFTYSSTRSSAVETAWILQKNGCTLNGMIEINERSKDIFTGEHKKAHGFLFSI